MWMFEVMAALPGVTSAMSEVISFRLDKSNPWEALAFVILEVWCSDGFTLLTYGSGVGSG
jgi:hypothetical protein